MVANKEQDDVLTKWLYDMIFLIYCFLLAKKSFKWRHKKNYFV